MFLIACKNTPLTASRGCDFGYFYQKQAMPTDIERVSRFYDEFFKDQVNVRVNERIIFCLDQLKRSGLRPSSTVLELGCGGGTLTYLLSRKIKTGRIEAVDISPYAIAFARKNILQKNVQFHVQDIANFHCGQAFDYITLFDVLEHIPIPDHARLFRTIESMMAAHSVLLINIPNPRYLEYDRSHHPESLQIIDQPLFPDHIASMLAQTDLYLQSLTTNSIWVEDDYQFLIVKKNTPFTEKKLTDKRNFRQKAVARLKREWQMWRYRYPTRTYIATQT